MPDPCPYCRRIMDGRRPLHATYPTKDHVIPQARGGERTVLVCRRCNMDKGSSPIQGWLALLERRRDPRALFVAGFIKANPWAIVPVLMEEP
jgi:5-methylcytosine-specific restriction endonuclease McrA